MAFHARILELATGGKSPFDGKLLKEYDPSRNGTSPEGRPMLAHIVVTDDPAEAMVFADLSEFHRTWTRIDERRPVRPDGRPNRPLTAFTVSTESVDD